MSKGTLQKARDILEKGWYQGGYGNGLGEYCIMGALGMANAGIVMGARREDIEAVGEHLADMGWTGGKYCTRLYCAHGCTHLPHFNDDPSTTKEMVLQLFDKAIANA